jgi:DNA polymerase III delta subunit
LGDALGTEPRFVRRPDEIADVAADLRTFSLFSEGKVVAVVESGVFADRATAAELFDDVRQQLPWSGEAGDLSGRARDAAARLLQVLRLFDLDPGQLGFERALAALPDSLLLGKATRGGAKSKSGAEEVRAGLLPLLAAAVGSGLRGLGESAASLVADLVRDGLPDRHALVLIESAVAEAHPLREALARREAVAFAGELTAEKGKFEGLEALVAELERETGAGIERAALDALARRTLRSEGASFGKTEIDPDSTARFAGEYRKLAALSGGATIRAAQVAQNVEDRGQEDVFQLLEAIGSGRPAEALARLDRYLGGAEDPVAGRLQFFGLLAGFCRHMVAIRGIAAAVGVPTGERDYSRFKARWVGKLQGEIPGLSKNPLAGLNPYRLYKEYLAACRVPATTLETLPSRVLETERRLKGDSGDPDAALAALILAIAGK